MNQPTDPDGLLVGTRNRVRRARERGRYDRQSIYRMLDSSVICHLGYLDEDDDGCYPVVTPTVHWRIGEHAYWHGAEGTRYMKASREAEVCLTVTHFDGLVLARSAFHHSANYRSVMILGKAEAVTDAAEKLGALRAMIEKLYPGRWDVLRPMTEGEFNGTSVARVAIDAASAKVRSGPPIDEEADYQLELWAGVVPAALRFEAPVDDPRLGSGLGPPDHATRVRKRFE